MADEKGPRNRREERGRRKTSPSLTLSHGPLVRAKDNAFSTKVRVVVSGWWEGGLPREATLYLDGETVNQNELHDRSASFPLTGLQPESHHKIGVRIREHWTEDLLVVPALPKPKQPKRIIARKEKFEGGKYNLLFQVLDSDGNPVAGAVMRVMDSTEKNGFRDLKETDAHGVTEDAIVLGFREKERHISFWVLGTDVKGWKRIYR